MAKKNANTATAEAPVTGDVSTAKKPITVKPASLKVIQSIAVPPSKLILTEQFRGRTADVPESEIVELADNIAAEGQKVPVQVRPIPGTDTFTVIFGNCRTRAAKMIESGYVSTTSKGEPKHIAATPDFRIRVEVVECDDTEAFKANVIENARRKGTSPIDDMENHDVLRSAGMSDAAITRFYGYASQATVSRLKNLRNLEPEYQQLVHAGSFVPPTPGSLTLQAGLRLAECTPEERAAVYAKCVGDGSGNGYDDIGCIGRNLVVEAINHYREEQKEKAAGTNAPLVAGGGAGATTTQNADGTHTVAGGAAAGAPPATGKKDPLTIKQFKTMLEQMGGNAEAPPLVQEYCTMVIGVLAGETTINAYAEWLSNNLKIA